jgi:TonB-linked SusC/RagA family outer membrane protein
MKKILILMSFLIMASMVFGQVRITGTVTSSDDGITLPGVTVLVKGTGAGTTTNQAGKYAILVPENAVLSFSYIGYVKQEIILATGQTSLDVDLKTSVEALDQVVVVGYGTQKKSDVTGAVTTVPAERLEMIPITNIGQAMQGAVPGVTIVTNSGGAEGSDMSLLVRGRNSIKASNSPLVVLDGIPYSGSISEINPDDVASLEILKDASSAAIYGSRGANGVILITTKKGKTGKPTINYKGFTSIQKIAHMPEYLTGAEFYDFKNIRDPEAMTSSEEEMYQSGDWTNWIDEATQTGRKQQHTLSLSGGTEDMKYFISGTMLDVKGLAVNDLFKRYSTRFNLEANVTSWLKIGTNTQLSLTDRAGRTASWSGGTDGAFYMNPLSKVYEENGDLALYPWLEDNYWKNPLQHTLADSFDKRYKVFTNNYIAIDIPFIPGLQYKLNTGIEYDNRQRAEYYGRNTTNGFESQGESDTRNRVDNNMVVENIVTYKKEIGKHNLFLTGLYSYQSDSYEEHRTEASGFPNDVLTWYQASTGNLINPSSGYANEDLVSQMVRMNYSFDSRYLLTVTGRRDGFSGFGSNTKWGLFPSVAVGWNVANEDFFKSDAINELKIRGSWGQNGNQAVGPYATLARLTERSYLNGTMSASGYIPSRLANPDLGWEHSTSMNIGVDFGLLKNRITGSIDAFDTYTVDLLLDRQISSVHGITSITQNIGETKNRGIELALTTHNVRTKDFSWTTSGTISLVKNEIVSIYGYLDEDGNEIDDLLNRLFIGQPINVNFGRSIIGTWQEDDDIANSAQPDAMPGYAKVLDVNEDGIINDEDRSIQGQRDPKSIYSFTNTLKYKNFTFSFYLYGVTGVTKQNTLKTDDVWGEVRRNTTKKDWWTPDNPTNDYYANDEDAHLEGGSYYENASFMRIKDVSLSYDVPVKMKKNGFNNLRVYVAARNLMTFTEFGGLDPEFSSQRGIPLEKEFLVGLIFGL